MIDPIPKTEIAGLHIEMIERGSGRPILFLHPGIGIDEAAARPGGVNIFGRCFGNHDQDILMRLHLRD